MQNFPPLLILRHEKENKKKCSLSNLSHQTDCQFFNYPLRTELPCLSQYLCLSLDGEVLSSKDADKGLFLIDATWRYAKRMHEAIPFPKKSLRSLPFDFKTAYRRRQSDCDDPERGLSSIEALYVAYRILGRDYSKLLSHYYWRDDFLQKNHHLLRDISSS